MKNFRIVCHARNITNRCGTLMVSIHTQFKINIYHFEYTDVRISDNSKLSSKKCTIQFALTLAGTTPPIHRLPWKPRYIPTRKPPCLYRHFKLLRLCPIISRHLRSNGIPPLDLRPWHPAPRHRISKNLRP